jgi:hypothetical protein
MVDLSVAFVFFNLPVRVDFTDEFLFGSEFFADSASMLKDPIDTDVGAAITRRTIGS